MSTMDENSFPRITIRIRNAVSYRAAVPFDVSGILAAYLSPPLLATHFSFHFVLFFPCLLLSAHSITLSFFILTISESIFRCLTLSFYIKLKKNENDIWIPKIISDFADFFIFSNIKNKDISCHFIEIQIILIWNIDCHRFLDLTSTLPLSVFSPSLFSFSILIFLFFMFS